jgi:hypothetical protein
MIVAHPSILWLLSLSLLLAWLDLRARSTRRRRWLVASLRVGCVAALVLALSRPMLSVRVAKSTLVRVVDVGPTMSADALAALGGARAGDARVVAFSNRAQVISDLAALQRPGELAALRERLARPVTPDDPVDGGSALAAALQLASAEIAPGAHGEVRLLTNGLATRGDAEAEAFRLASRGIAIRVEPAAVAVDRAPPVVVRSFSTPHSARVGQTITADVVVESRVPGDVRVSLTAGAGELASTVVTMTPGTRVVRLSVPLRAVGLAKVTATAGVAGAPGDAMASAIQVDGPARVLLVRDPATDSGTAAALGQLLGASATIQVIAPAELAGRSMSDFDAIVLADVPADQLSGEGQRAIRQANNGGAGLLVTGAARSFGPGGYDGSTLASLLPVRMPQQLERIDPSTTLVLIIDTSGSMQGQRIDLAKEVSRLAISHLQAHDKVGIVEFYGGKRWALPIQSAANSAAIGRALNRLTAGGGTTLYPALEEASFALRSIETRAKHVIVLSDGGIEDAPFAPLLRQMAEDGVVTSAVVVAPEPGVPDPLPDLARWGSGRFYSVPDQFELADITLKQPRLSRLSPIVDRPSKVVATNEDLVGAEEVATWRPIGGYVRTVAKPMADVLLSTSEGDPLLVRWRSGAGFVAAMPTQLGSAMTRSLQDQPSFARMIAGLFRQIAKPQAQRLTVRPQLRPAGVEVDVSASDMDAGIAKGTLRLEVIDAQGGVVRGIAAEPIASGHWNVLLAGVPSGTYTVTAAVDRASARGQAGLAVPGSRQWPGVSTDHALLDRIAGFQSLAGERAAAMPAEGESFVDLRNGLAAAAVVLLLLHVAARRWPAAGRVA